MKKFKVVLSVLLSIMMLIGCMPLAGLVSAEETEDKVYTIFAANPDVFEVGQDVTVAKTAGNITSSNTVTIATENGEKYHTLTQNFVTGGGIYGGFTVAGSGESSNSKGTNDFGTEWSLGWTGNAAAVTALSNTGLVTGNMDYRITHNATTTAKYITRLYGISNYTSSGKIGNNIWAGAWPPNEFGTWKTVTFPSAKLDNFYSGFLCFKVDFDGKSITEDLTVVLDFKNIKLTVKESDRDAINTALTGTGVTFDDLIAPYLEKEEAEEPIVGEDMAIYKANPFKAGIVGTDVSVADRDGNTGLGAVEVKSDDDGAYFSYTDEYALGQGQYNRRYHYYMGYNDKSEGLGWMANQDVTDKIIGKITASMKVRITPTITSGSAPKDYPLYFGIFNREQSSGQAASQTILRTSITETGKWIEITNIPTTALPGFYSGYACVRIEPKVFDGSVTVDMKDFKLTINSADKADIDAALADTDWDFDSLTATFSTNGLINPDEMSADTDVIWYANPDKVTSENGGDVTADKLSADLPFNNTNKTIKVYDENGAYYRTTMNVTGEGGNGASTIFKTNIKKETPGYGWLNSKEAMQALLPYVNLSLVYRFDGTVPTGGGTPYIYINGVNGYKRIWNTAVAIKNSGQWYDVSMQAIGGIFDDVYGWYNTDIALNIYAWNASFSGTQRIDIKDMRWELKAADRVYINKALSEVEGIDNIPNFTEGVELATDVNGYKDYYSLLVNPVKSATKFDVDDDGVTTVKDLIRLKKYEGWEIELNAMMIERADSNADGEVDATDIADCRKALISK